MAHALESPDDHRLLARLALNWVEANVPVHAADVLERALLLSPECPMLLWYRAGVLELMGRHDIARATYALLVERGIGDLATGECGLGRHNAEGLVADCFHRLSVIDAQRGRIADATEWHTRLLASLGQGHHGVYTLDDILTPAPPDQANAIRLRREERPSDNPHAFD